MKWFNPFSWFRSLIHVYEVSIPATGFSMYGGATSQKQALQKVKEAFQSGEVGFEGLSKIDLEDVSQYRVERF